MKMNLRRLLAIFASLTVLFSAVSVSAIEPPPSSSSSPSSPPSSSFAPRANVNRYITWANGVEGAVLRNVTIRDLGMENGGLAVFTKETFPQDTQFFQFPLRAAIHADYVGRTRPLAELFMQVHVSETNHLAFILLYEKFVVPDSRWKDYLNALPTSFTTPLYYTEQEFEELKGSAVANIAAHRKKDFQTKFQELKTKILEVSEVFTEEILTEENYLWALSIVMSRTISLEVSKNGGKIKYSCIIPVLDLLNTGYPDEINSACQITKDHQHVECHTTKVVPKGAELLKSYGTGLTNAQYLIDYGLVFEQNDDDTLEIELPTIYPDNIERKEEMFKELGSLFTQQLSIDTHKQTHLTLSWKRLISELKGFMSQMRLLELGEEEIILKRKETIEKLKKFEMINEKNEKSAIEAILKHLRNRLAKYPTTLEQDEKLLNELFEIHSNEVVNKRNAVMARLGEKRLIKHNISDLEERVKKLAKSKATKKSGYKTNPAWSKEL